MELLTAIPTGYLVAVNTCILQNALSMNSGTKVNVLVFGVKLSSTSFHV